MLVENINNNSSWKPLLFTLEIGVRGFIATSTQQVFLKLGLQRQTISSLLKRLSATAAKCSHTILLAASSKTWENSRALLDFQLILDIYFVTPSAHMCTCILKLQFVGKFKCRNRPWTGQHRQGGVNCVDQSPPLIIGGQGSKWLIN